MGLVTYRVNVKSLGTIAIITTTDKYIGNRSITKLESVYKSESRPSFRRYLTGIPHAVAERLVVKKGKVSNSSVEAQGCCCI